MRVQNAKETFFKRLIYKIQTTEKGISNVYMFGDHIPGDITLHISRDVIFQYLVTFLPPSRRIVILQIL